MGEGVCRRTAQRETRGGREKQTKAPERGKSFRRTPLPPTRKGGSGTKREGERRALGGEQRPVPMSFKGMAPVGSLSKEGSADGLKKRGPREREKSCRGCKNRRHHSKCLGNDIRGHARSGGVKSSPSREEKKGLVKKRKGDRSKKKDHQGPTTQMG